MIQADANLIRISFLPSVELDVVGYVTHAVPESELVNGDFTPSLDNQVNAGPETAFTFSTTQSGLWYVKTAAYDSFENVADIRYSQLTYSAAVSVDVPSDGSPRGLWSSAGVKYYKGDEVILEGSTWGCLTTHVSSSTNGPPIDGSLSNLNWIIKAQAGSTAKYVIVNGDPIFKFESGSLVPTVTSTTLAALLYGGLNTYSWEYWSVDHWVPLLGDNTKSTYTLAYDSPVWSSTTLIVRCASKVEAGATEVYYDSMTIIKLYDGVIGGDGLSALSVVVPNSSHTLPATNGGTVTSYVGSSTTIRVFEGATELAYDGVGNDAGTWRLTAVGTDITPGAITDSGTFATVGLASAMANVSVASVLYTLTGKRASNIAFSTTAIQTFTKSFAGSIGQGQVKGVSFIRSATAPATPTGGSYSSPNATTTGWSDGIPADNNQPLYMSTRLFTSDGLAPQQATWTTPQKIGTPSTGSKLQFSVDGVSWHDIPNVNDVYMRSGVSTDNGVTWIWGGAVKIKGEQGPQGVPGTSALTGYLTNETHTVATNADGTGGDYSGAVGNFKVFLGTTDVTAGCTFSIAGGTVATIDNENITAAGYYSLTGMSADVGKLTLRAVHTSSGAIIDKEFTVSKARTGNTGASAQYVRVSGPQAFKYLTGANTPEVNPIILKAALYGGLTTYSWEYWDGSAWGTLNNTTYILTLYHDATVWGTSSFLRVRCVSGAYSDEYTIVKLYDGSNGSSYFTGTVYKQAASAPTAPVGGTYNFATGVITPPSGWTITQPATTTTPTYACDFTFIGTGSSTVTAGTWTNVHIDAVAGAAGSNGSSVFVIELYSVAATAPTTPTGVSYTFSTDTLTGIPAGWSRSMPATGTTPTWMSSYRYETTTPTVAVVSGAWATPVAVAQKGADGLSGFNTATVYIYRRSTTAPALPTVSTTYTFATATLAGLDGGWSQNIPAGTDPLYVSAATAAARTDTDNIAATEWAAPTILSTTGANGSNGLNSATVYLFQRTDTPVIPAKPSSDLVYTFSTSVLTGTLGNWAQSMPTTGGAYRWMISATAVNVNSSDTIVPTEWSEASIIAQDGSDGAAGQDGQTLYTWVKYADTPTSGMSDSPTGKKYLGLAVNKQDPAESPLYSAYTWSLIEGPQGIAGTDGADGVTKYTWVKYADSPTSGMSDYPDGKKYIGLAFNKDGSGESAVYSEYSWSLLSTINGYLTNESHTVSTANDGTGGNYTIAGGSFKVFLGASDVTASCTFTKVSSSAAIVNGAISTAGVYSLTDLTADYGTMTLRATHTATGATIDKVYTIAKSKAGATGSVGDTGAAGPALILTSNGQAFTFTDSVATPASQTLTFTIVRQNVTGTATFTTSPTVTLTGTGDSRSLTLANFGSNDQVTITATVGAVSDTMTVIRLNESTAAAGATNDLVLVGRNCSIVGNTVTKVAPGVTGSWDADCYSRDAYTGGAYCSFLANQTNANVLVGLNDDPATDTNYTGVTYGWNPGSAGTAYTYENGVVNGPYGSYTTNTVFSITYDGVSVLFMMDGVVKRTVAATSGQKLFLDSAFQNVGTSVRGVRFGPLTGTPPTTVNTSPPSSPRIGETWYNSSTTNGTYLAKTQYVWNGTAWVVAGPVGTFINSAGAYIGSLTANAITLGDGTTYGKIETYDFSNPLKTSGIQILDGATPSITIKGGTFTGNLIQTALTGKRVVISQSTNKAHFYGDNGLGTNTIIELGTIGVTDGGFGNSVGTFGSSTANVSGIIAHSNGWTPAGKFYTWGGATEGATSAAVFAQSKYGYGAQLSQGGFVSGIWEDSGKSPLRLQPSKSSAAPTHAALPGSFWITSAGVLYINATAGTAEGTTWQKVGAQ